MDPSGLNLDIAETRIPLLFCNDILEPSSTKQYRVKYLNSFLSQLRFYDNDRPQASFDFIPWERHLLGIISDKSMTCDNPKDKVGTVALIIKMGMNTLDVTGICKFNLVTVIQRQPFVIAKTQLFIDKKDIKKDDPSLSSLRETFNQAVDQLFDYIKPTNPYIKNDKGVLKQLSLSQVLDIVTYLISPSPELRKTILDIKDVQARAEFVMEVIQKAIPGMQRFPPPSNMIDLNMLRRNTPPAGARSEELHQLEHKIKDANMPQEAYDEANKQLKRLMSMSQFTPEYGMIHNYLEVLVSLPWSKYAQQNNNLKEAIKVLNEAHYGQDKIKKRVIEYLCVSKLRSSNKAPILCLLGPPGVGKTSIAESIAKALGRPFHRMSLGGISDVHDIRGHRRTYIGSMPGRIIQGLKRVKVKNPVFLLDEVDKISMAGIKGDPTAALLEVLDPEQNNTFTDTYINLPFDLSQVLFVATANNMSCIPLPLLDRMEIIQVPGYTLVEKIMISKNYLIPKQLDRHGLKSELIFHDESIRQIITEYTREAGVRDLERNIAAICRSVAMEFTLSLDHSQEECQDEGIDDCSESDCSDDEAQDYNKFCVIIDSKYIQSVLGPPLYLTTLSHQVTTPGVAVGLAWTPAGGEVMVVEGSFSPTEKSDLILTGQLGSVMRESVLLAMSWIMINCTKYGINPESIREKGTLHLHFPCGAIKKDGPSAGVTIVTVIMSLLSNVCVKDDIAMTGEITLNGIVLPVGGIKEKVLAAHTNNFKNIILPCGNAKDEVDLPPTVLNDLNIIYVKTLDEVLSCALVSYNLKSQL